MCLCRLPCRSPRGYLYLGPNPLSIYFLFHTTLSSFLNQCALPTWRQAKGQGMKDSFSTVEPSSPAAPSPVLIFGTMIACYRLIRRLFTHISSPLEDRGRRQTGRLHSNLDKESHHGHHGFIWQLCACLDLSLHLHLPYLDCTAPFIHHVSPILATYDILKKIPRFLRPHSPCMLILPWWRRRTRSMQSCDPLIPTSSPLPLPCRSGASSLILIAQFPLAWAHRDH